MATKIEWADETWNPVTGCTPVSEGCANCYARRMAQRLRGRFGYPDDEPFRVTEHSDRLDQPFRWKKPRRIFVCSMGDLFHEAVSFRYTLEVFDIMRVMNKHTYIVLTKRPHRLLEYLDFETARRGVALWRPSHIWLGVTAENQRRADERIPLLLNIPGRRFVSCEPLLGPINFNAVPWQQYGGLEGWKSWSEIDWVIAGGETGPGARPMDPAWARSLRDQCQEVGVPFFMKQMGRRGPIPDDLMVREWPQGYSDARLV